MIPADSAHARSGVRAPGWCGHRDFLTKPPFMLKASAVEVCACRLVGRLQAVTVEQASIRGAAVAWQPAAGSACAGRSALWPSRPATFLVGHSWTQVSCYHGPGLQCSRRTERAFEGHGLMRAVVVRWLGRPSAASGRGRRKPLSFHRRRSAPLRSGSRFARPRPPLPPPPCHP